MISYPTTHSRKQIKRIDIKKTHSQIATRMMTAMMIIVMMILTGRISLGTPWSGQDVYWY